jgi:multidrug resistance efflux pump
MPRKRLITIVAVVAVLIVLYNVVPLLLPHPLEGSGTVEARDIHVGSKVGGRIAKVLAREGDRVDAGQVLITFEDKDLEAQLDQARARLEQAKANYEKMAHGYQPEEVAEARSAALSARASYDEMRNGFRHEEVEQAKADLDRANAEEQNAEINYKRAQDLWSQGVVSKQFFDDAEMRVRTAKAALESAQQHSRELSSGQRRETVEAAEAKYKQADAVYRRIERGFRPEDVAAAKADLDHAEGELKAAEDRYRERQVISPAPAYVEVLDVRPGDLIAPNTPIATLLERDQTYVRIYVPETRIGKVALGQRADIKLDAFPGQTFAGTVEQINQKAEFLPRNVQTKEERVHQVLGVKLRINDPDGRVRAGMAADVRLKDQAATQRASAQ